MTKVVDFQGKTSPVLLTPLVSGDCDEILRRFLWQSTKEFDGFDV